MDTLQILALIGIILVLIQIAYDFGKFMGTTKICGDKQELIKTYDELIDMYKQSVVVKDKIIALYKKKYEPFD